MKIIDQLQSNHYLLKLINESQLSWSNHFFITHKLQFLTLMNAILSAQILISAHLVFSSNKCTNCLFCSLRTNENLIFLLNLNDDIWMGFFSSNHFRIKFKLKTEIIKQVCENFLLNFITSSKIPIEIFRIKVQNFYNFY